ncbi:DUF475 domain-containing protein [Consotaella aegiceratis]|uniref:DUF475 domain-containing protein n=1 Tax=Consotaella aegiceratis TaxID=3097961 RepID=UPI002F425781
MRNFRYFYWAAFFTVVGLAMAAWLGFETTGTWRGAASVFVICGVLAILEISLSFDNAIINATVLEEMTPKWQRRFLTWGILIAVFGMRIIFPLVIVAVAAHINPFAALQLAIYHPDQYAHIMHGSRIAIDAFGGTFLMMVGLEYFFDANKEVHWIAALERRLVRCASLKGIEVGVVLALVLLFCHFLPEGRASTFAFSAIYGLLTFLAVEAIGRLLDASQSRMDAVHRGGLGAFLYLEMLDASFSFDGVIGAFALSTNLFVIAIGLGIGAFYVRSLTIMLVEKKTLGEYRFLEHGAFYAILVLAVIMYAQTMLEIPEVMTGLVGAVLIVLALFSSIRYNRQCAACGDDQPAKISNG